jgi:catechol 2,3-dioxygenase-like lactoylglutathione lyase family enzyme
MPRLNARLAGVELYFQDLTAARHFYQETLGLQLTGEEPGHHAQFGDEKVFLCLEKKGVEDYPSRDKAVVFLEVSDVAAAVEAIGRDRIVKYVPATRERAGWAVLHDPEDHNVLLLEGKAEAGAK